MKKLSLIFICILIFISCLVYLLFRHQNYEDKSNCIRLSIASEPATFNPIVAQDALSQSIASFMFEGLTKVDANTLKIKPCLAKRWEYNKTKKEWTFYLRTDVVWSDGEKFTAQDVLFTYNDIIFNKDIPTSSRDVLSVDGKPIKVKKLDDYTVVFEMPSEFAPFLMEASHIILPFHKLNTSVAEKKFAFTWGINTKPKELVGTGPFLLEKYDIGEKIVLKKNSNYWNVKDGKRLPLVDFVVFSIMPNRNTSILKFLRNEIDVIDIAPENYDYIKKNKNSSFEIFNAGPSLGCNFIAFNQNSSNPCQYKKDIFLNEKFRKAIAYAIDKDAIIKNVFYGMAVNQSGPFTEANKIFYNKNISKYSLNITKAKKLLTEIGFSHKNKDGILEDSNGNKAEFTLLITSESKQSVDISNIVQNDLKKLGINLQIVALQFNLLVSKIISTSDWDCVLLGFTGSIDPHSGKNVWDSKGQLHCWLKDGQTPEWSNKIDEIFNKGVKEIDLKKRKMLYNEWQSIASSKLPLIYLVCPTVQYGINTRLKNVHPSAYGGVFHNVEEMEI